MLEKLAERVRSIDINQILDEVLDDQRFFILDLIRSQLNEGELGDGSLFPIYSSLDYVEEKHKRGLFVSGSDPHYDLRGFTSEFYNSLILTLRAKFIEIESLDPKIRKIETNLDKEINNSNTLVLNPKNLQILIDRIKPLIQQKINARLGI